MDSPTAGGEIARGVTKDAVYIGYGADDGGVGVATKAMGLSGIGDPGDTAKQLAAVAADINRHGGLAGKKIILVPHVYRTVETINDPNTAAQAACADMNDDHRVFAMIMPGVYNDVAKECFNKVRVPLILSGGAESPISFRDDYARFPNYVFAGGMLGERFFDTAIHRLVARSFFQRWDTKTGAPGGAAPVKIGMLVPDTRSGTKELAASNAALRQAGLKVDVVVRIPDSIQGGSSAASSAALRFRVEGVTHVLRPSLPFMSTAQQQGYYPRYWHYFALQVIATSAPPEQLRGTMAEGLAPGLDVDDAHDPGTTAGGARCLRVMREAGHRPSSRTALWAMQTICDSLYTIKAAIDRSNEVTFGGFMRGLAAVGPQDMAVNWVNRWAPGERASARALRDMSFDAACKCFYYTDKINRVATR